jgi:hypothetical protein
MNKTCLSYWFPKIESAGLPVPKTLIFDMNEEVQRGIYRVFDGEPMWRGSADWIATNLGPAVDFVGLPAFLRTGLTSGKHRWKDTCFVDDAGKLASHVVALVEFSECCDFMGLPWSKWVVREMLPTVHQFTADRYGDMPVCREFRFFVRDGEVQCVHPYWPRESLEQGMRQAAEDFDWRYQCLSYMPGVDTCELYRLAATAGKAVGGYWSVDILETKRGWFVTDMAEGEKSWHWPECSEAPQ